MSHLSSSIKSFEGQLNNLKPRAKSLNIFCNSTVLLHSRFWVIFWVKICIRGYKSAGVTEWEGNLGYLPNIPELMLHSLHSIHIYASFDPQFTSQPPYDPIARKLKIILTTKTKKYYKLVKTFLQNPPLLANFFQ